jgi:hypothetical protein
VEPLTQTRFADGPMRPVFVEAGRQFVLAGDGRRVYGVWFIPPGDVPSPIIVEAGRRPPEDL